MYDLTKFTLRDMTECGIALRNLSVDAGSMEEVADKIVHYLYDHLIDRQTGEKICALVRFYKTHPFGELHEELQRFALDILGSQPASSSMKCLTLMATVGVKPEWHSRKASAGHQAIPLPSKELVAQAPMISNLIQQFGLEIDTVLAPNPNLLVDVEQRSYNVFHVPDAAGSPYIPAQEEFVVPFGVRSVLGFGGMLPSGNLFAIILFSQSRIQREVAEMFKTLALSIKLVVLSFEDTVFALSH